MLSHQHTLMDRLVHHYRDLDAFRERVRGNPNEHDLYVPQIESERERLLGQIRALGGDAAVGLVLCGDRCFCRYMECLTQRLAYAFGVP